MVDYPLRIRQPLNNDQFSSLNDLEISQSCGFDLNIYSNYHISTQVPMMNFFDSLCGCFSPDLKRNIIDYLSSANLNRQLIEEEKCSEENQPPEKSIYAQVKTKSYYFMKLKEEEDNLRQPEKQPIPPPDIIDNSLEPNYYPHELPQNIDTYDQVYSKKIAALRKILTAEIGHEYSKIYDSQDDLNLKIYCKPQIYPSRRINVYRFTFNIPHTETHKLAPQNYLKLSVGTEVSSHQPLLEKKKNISKTDTGVDICHRCYKKILVIQQHEFYTAQKCQLLEEQNKQVVYNTVFSIEGSWEKETDHQRGWVHLAGMRASIETHDEQHSTSLRESETHLHFEGYINVELDITINANMLKQPIAKEIRVYVQKLVCSLTNSDAI